MKKELTCIICPKGCRLTAEGEGDTLAVSGCGCRRGEAYARTECTDPRRTVTSTVRCEGNVLVAVKTDGAIPKERMADCMRLINSVNPPLPISVGDVIIENVFGSRVIATQNAALRPRQR